MVLALLHACQDEAQREGRVNGCVCFQMLVLDICTNVCVVLDLSSTRLVGFKCNFPSVLP